MAAGGFRQPYWETCREGDKLQNFGMNDYKLFLEKHRPEGKNINIMLCKVDISSATEVQWFLVRDLCDTPCEIQAMAQIGILEREIFGDGVGRGRIEFYINYLPRVYYANLIKKYIEDRKGHMTLKLRYCRLYESMDGEDPQELKILKGCQHQNRKLVYVDKFSQSDWDVLESKMVNSNENELNVAESMRRDPYWETCQDGETLKDFKMKDYKVFLENCRPYPNTKTTLLLCKVVINEEVQWFFVRNIKYTHSEIQAVAQIGILEKIYGQESGLSEVVFYISYSPCLYCAKILAQYINGRNDRNDRNGTNVSMTLRFSALHIPYRRDQETEEALKELKDCGIDISTFSTPDWDILERKGSILNPLNPEEVDSRNSWDLKMCKEFQKLVP